MWLTVALLFQVGKPSWSILKVLFRHVPWIKLPAQVWICPQSARCPTCTTNQTATWSWQSGKAFELQIPGTVKCSLWVLCIGYRLRWRSDIWRTDRGVAEVRSPGIRPATDDDIRHNAPGLLETVDQLLRTKVRRKLLNQDKPSRLASYALQQHKAKSPRLAASEFSFLLAVLRRSRWVCAVEQAWDENFETSSRDGRAW